MKDELRALMDRLADDLFSKLQDKLSTVLQPSGNLAHQSRHSNPEAQYGPPSGSIASEQNGRDREDQSERCHQLLTGFKFKLDNTLNSLRLDVSSVVTDCVMELDDIIHSTSPLGGKQTSSTNPYPALPSQLKLPTVGVFTTSDLPVL
jgi:hypothetical protein